MGLSKAQWQVVETKLSSPYGRVELQCDGYKINAVVERDKGLKWCVVVYVDGVYKGEWMDGKDVRAQKFHSKKTRYFYAVKLREQAKAKLKRRLKYAWEKEHYQHVLDTKTEFWLPFWASPKAFCRHIRKTCEVIEMMD